MPQSTSLKGFFFPPGREMSSETRKRLESSEGMKRTSESLDREAAAADWPGTFGLIGDRIADTLDIDIGQDILLKVWNEGKLFDRYRNPEKYDPKETIRITLSEHSIKSSHRPSIELKLNDTVIRKLNFEVEVELDIDGAVLELQNGRIMKLKAGTCTAKGEMSFEGLLLIKEKSKPIEFPAEIDFGDGIEIAPVGSR